MILQIFFIKTSITQPRKVQIPKCWCLKSLIDIFLQLPFSWLGQKIAQFWCYRGKKCQKPSKLCNILVFEMRKLHFLQIPFGLDFKFNYSDIYKCNGGQTYENLIWELLSLLVVVLDRRAHHLRKHRDLVHGVHRAARGEKPKGRPRKNPTLTSTPRPVSQK